MIIGFAQAILVIFNTAGLMDTIMYYASDLLGNVPGILSAVGMFVLQLAMNFFVPSGSGQAALTMPLMAPLSDMIGVTRQTAVLGYQLGDGIANSIFPTGNIIAALAVAGISYGKWIYHSLLYKLLLRSLHLLSYRQFNMARFNFIQQKSSTSKVKG